MPGEVGDGGDARVGTQRVEGSAREVEDFLHTEDHLKPRRDEEEDGGVKHTAHEDIDEVRRHRRGVYSMTRSARPSSDGGMVRPSAFAVRRLTTSSNVEGCSTGRSPGL